MRDRLRDMRIEWKRSANIKGVPGGKTKIGGEMILDEEINENSSAVIKDIS